MEGLALLGFGPAELRMTDCGWLTVSEAILRLWWAEISKVRVLQGLFCRDPLDRITLQQVLTEIRRNL